MAIRVYGWRKPTLEVSAVAGGDLLPDTKYYIAGAMGKTPRTYQSLAGPVSDIYDVTTTSVNKSILITQKTYRNITAFADGGGSVTNVTCERHCFDTNDTVKIASGSYTGTWTVTWIDYDTFSIPTAYVDDVPVECYSDTTKYNKALGMAYYIHPTIPVVDGVWSREKRWTRYPHQSDFLDNPLTITTQPVDDFSKMSSHPDFIGMNTGTNAVLSDYGTVYVLLSDGGSYDLEDVYDEVQSSGFIYNCSYSLAGYTNTPTFELAGCLYGVGGTQLSATQVSMTVWAAIYSADPTDFDFKNCGITFPASVFSVAMYFTATNCTIYNNASVTTYINWIYGDGNTLYVIPRVSYDPCDIVGRQYIDLDSGQLKNYGVITNKTFKNPSDYTLFQIAYNRNTMENCTTYPFYWIVKPSQGHAHPPIYMLEDVNIYETDELHFHYRFFSYDPAIPITVKYLNVDTDDANNVKKIVNNSLIELTASFWRGVNFSIQSEGVLINGANIDIQDGQSNSYQIATVNGEAYVEVLEQVTIITNADGTHGSWNSNHDIYNSDFVITISKEGYDPLIIKFDSISGNETLQLGLTAVDPASEFVGSGLTNAYETESMRHLFLNEPVLKVGDAGGLLPSVAAGSLYAALFTQSPGEAGSIANEATFGGYARVPVPRGPTGWSEYLGKVRNVNQVNFPDCTDGTEIISHYALMKEPTGSEMVAQGEIDDPVEVIPQYQLQFAPTRMEFNID